MSWIGPQRDETGATVLLALVLIVCLALVLLSFASATSNDVRNASNLGVQRSLEFAAEGATSMAIQIMRFNGDPYMQFNGTTYIPNAGDCAPGGSPVTVGNVPIYVSCSGVHFEPLSAESRVISVTACSAACTSANIVVTAVVTFDDFSSSQPHQCTFQGNTSTCGSTVSIDSWLVQKANS